MPFQARLFSTELQLELDQIAVEGKALLRIRYVTLFNREPPRAFGPDLLRRSVAQKLQEDAHGALSKSVQRELDRLVAAFIVKPDVALSIARRAQFGTVLVRDWKGKSHRVLIVEDGFGYEGKVFSSLSEIARLITGTRWNGPRFFGLRRQPSEQPRTSRRPPVALASTWSSIPPKRRRVVHGL